MDNKRLIFTGVFFLFLIILVPAFYNPKPQEKTLYLVGAKIYTSPNAVPIENGVVMIEEGKIKAVGSHKKIPVPTNARKINCKGLIMTSGFWNSHVHFMESHWHNAGSLPAAQLNSQLEDMLTSFGFVYALDIAALEFENLDALRTRIKTGEVTGPEILRSGIPFVPENGSPFYIAPLKLPEISTPEQAGTFVKKQIKNGANVIKLWSASPIGNKIVNMPHEVLLEAVQTANDLGIPVAAHPTNNEGVTIAINAGVDILVHTSPDDRELWDMETINKMILNKMALIPTLKLYKWDLEQHNIPVEKNPLILTSIGQLRDFSRAGGEILFGTDVGYMTDYNPTEEYELMVEADMSFMQLLASLTTNPAKRFGRPSQTGEIKVGLDADLVLLKGDPSDDIRNLARVVTTIKKGEIIYNTME